MKIPGKFIIIDDDPTAVLLCSIMIRHALGTETKVQTFVSGDESVRAIENEYDPEKAERSIVLFLDINMPVTSGWEVLEMISQLNDNIKRQLCIFMLSSSIDPADRERSMNHQMVCDFIEKPLTADKVAALFKNEPVLNSRESRP